MCISTGGRPHVARAKIARLIDRGVRGLVSFGIAGALSPDLRTGDLVVADAVINDIGEIWRTHEPWVDAMIGHVAGHHADDVPHHAAARRPEGHARSAPLWSSDRDLPADGDAPARAASITSAVKQGPSARHPGAGRRIKVGAILGLDRILPSTGEKAEAFARRGTFCVDMESHHVARAAAERGLPFIAVRAISDQAHEALPAVMADFVDDQGETRMSAVLAALILGRVGLGMLLQAGRASRRAHQALLRCRGALAGLG
jgi:nucleoside phosphorylase